VKFSVRQILASAAGAVTAAFIASLFGVNGTIVGVAVGSMVATFGTALVAQSLERTQTAMKQVVVRVPDRSNLLRRFGGTRAIGATESAPTETTPLAEGSTTTTGHSDDTVQVEITPPALDHDTEVVPVTAMLPAELVAGLAAGFPTEEVDGAAAPAGPATSAKRNIRWPLIWATAGGVFVLSLAFVTVVELIAGQPLTNLFGGHTKSHSPSVGQIFGPGPVTTTSTTVPPTSTTSSTSTSTTSTSSTTTTTVPGETTTTNGGSATTTSTTSGSATTTTAGSTTTTNAAGG